MTPEPPRSGRIRSHRTEAAQRGKGSVQVSQKLQEDPVDLTGLMAGRSSGCPLAPPDQQVQVGRMCPIGRDTAGVVVRADRLTAGDANARPLPLRASARGP